MQKLLLRRIYLCKGMRNVAGLLKEVKKDIKVILEDDEIEHMRLKKLVIDCRELRLVNGLPTRRAVDYHLGVLVGRGLVILEKHGAVRQCHVFPVLTRKCLEMIEGTDVFRDVIYRF